MLSGVSSKSLKYHSALEVTGSRPEYPVRVGVWETKLTEVHSPNTRKKGDPVQMKHRMVNKSCVHLQSCTIAIKP